MFSRNVETRTNRCRSTGPWRNPSSRLQWAQPNKTSGSRRALPRCLPSTSTWVTLCSKYSLSGTPGPKTILPSRVSSLTRTCSRPPLLSIRLISWHYRLISSTKWCRETLGTNNSRRNNRSSSPSKQGKMKRRLHLRIKSRHSLLSCPKTPWHRWSLSWRVFWTSHLGEVRLTLIIIMIEKSKRGNGSTFMYNQSFLISG